MWVAADLASPPQVSWLGLGGRAVPGREFYAMGDCWALHCYRYRGRLTVNGRSFRIVPGSRSITPAFAQLDYRFDDHGCEHCCFHFRLAAPPSAAWELPVFARAAAAVDRLEEVLTWWPAQRQRVEARLWDELWGLARPRQPEAAVGERQLQRALAVIEERLATGLNVAELAACVDLSPTHLARLFRAGLGCSPSAFLRRRRVHRAHHLLVTSTRPIAAIAVQVGLSDLQHFNKTIRRELGASPRAIRAGARPRATR